MGREKDNRVLKVNRRAKPRMCRIIEDDVICRKPHHCRGLCNKHHSYAIRNELMEKLAAKRIFVYVEDSDYKINEKARASKCRINENGKNCTRKTHGRGLCSRHWLTFERHGLLKKYGTASRKDPRTFNLKPKIVKGVCRIKENHKNCNRKSTSRGLCGKHYLRFLRKEKLHIWGNKQ